MVIRYSHAHCNDIAALGLTLTSDKKMKREMGGEIQRNDNEAAMPLLLSVEMVPPPVVDSFRDQIVMLHFGLHFAYCT